MPLFWQPLVVVVLFSPPTLVLALGLQWLLRRRIANTWVRVLGSWAVVGAVLSVAFIALMNSFSDWPG